MLAIEQIQNGFANCNSCGATENVSRIMVGIGTDKHRCFSFSAFNLCNECQKTLALELVQRQIRPREPGQEPGQGQGQDQQTSQQTSQGQEPGQGKVSGAY